MKKILVRLLILFFITTSLGVAPQTTNASNDYTPNRPALVSGRTISDTLTNTEGSLVYPIQTSADGDIYATLNNIKGGVSASLYDEYGNTVDYYSTSSKGTIAFGDYEKAGNYVLVIKPYDWYDRISSASFDVKVTFPSGKVSYDSSFEPNDIMYNAYPLQSAKSITSTLSTNVDHDWYKFTNTRSGKAHFRLTELKGNMKITIYDEYGKYISDDTTYSESYTTLTVDLKEGNYFAVISPYDWNDKISNGKYTLKATFTNGQASFGADFEPNDIPHYAYPLKSGNLYPTTLNDETDVDWFKIQTLDDGDVQVALENLKGQVQVTLYDESLSYIADQYTYSYSNTALTESVKKGTYYVRVRPNGWEQKRHSGSYSIRTTFNNLNKTFGTNFEPNNTFENAFPIVSGRVYATDLYNDVDVDWYRVKTDKDGTIRINLSNVNGRVEVRLYDEYGNYRNSMDTWSYSSNYMETELKKGTYFFRVKPYGWEDRRTKGTYSLLVNFPSYKSIGVKVNGKSVAINPALVGGVIYLPAKDILKSFSATLSHNASKNTVTIKKGSKSYVSKIGSGYVTINGVKASLGSPFKMMNGKVYIPSSFITKQFKAKVSWDTNNNIVITK